MYLTLAVICVVGLSLIAIWIKRKRDWQRLEQHSITPDAANLDSSNVTVIDGYQHDHHRRYGRCGISLGWG